MQQLPTLDSGCGHTLFVSNQQQRLEKKARRHTRPTPSFSFPILTYLSQIHQDPDLIRPTCPPFSSAAQALHRRWLSSLLSALLPRTLVHPSMNLRRLDFLQHVEGDEAGGGMAPAGPLRCHMVRAGPEHPSSLSRTVAALSQTTSITTRGSIGFSDFRRVYL
jgi:hypothetical protein